jgi:hypothetical protein
MAGLIQGVITFLDGLGASKQQIVSKTNDSVGLVTPNSVLIDPNTGLPCGSANPYPIQRQPIAPAASVALEAGHIFAAQACTLYGFRASVQGTGGWIMLYDAAAIPADGAVIPTSHWAIDGNSTLSWAGLPIKLLNGCVLVFSFDGPFQQTSAAQAAFSAEVQ